MDGQGLRNVFEAFDSTIQKIRQRERRIHQSEQDMGIGAPDIQVGQGHPLPFLCKEEGKIGGITLFPTPPLPEVMEMIVAIEAASSWFVMVGIPSSDVLARKNMSGVGLVVQERCKTDHHVSQ